MINSHFSADTIADTDSILIAFTEAIENGSASVADWTGRYPTLGRDFVRIAAKNFVGDAEGETNSVQDERLRRVGQNVLLKFKGAYLGVQPLVSLVDKERGVTAANIAAATKLTVPFVAKLNQRLFTLASIPALVIERLATTVGRSLEEVTEFLAGPPMLARGAAYRSDEAPTVGEQEDFSVALRADTTISAEVKDEYK